MITDLNTVKISQLPQNSSPLPSDVLPEVSGGTTYKVNPGALSADYKSLAVTPSAVSYLGQHSYQLTFPAVDLSGVISNGMRLRFTRTAAAPTQSASFNGTTQYYSKATPNKMTFTDDFTVSAWIKVSSYATAMIVSRSNSVSGWALFMESTGQITLSGYSGSGANYRRITSSPSVPLNKWIHITAQLDMSANTATVTTSYVMFDGVDVPATAITSGTNPSALIQAGSLEIGSWNGGTLPFNGKIAQVAIYSAKVAQATMRGYISQGITGSETNTVSAYSLSGAITDLNTTTPNDLTANGAIVATNADSPFGGQASGAISASVDYGIIMSVSYFTDTTVIVQTPEGGTIPTTGGLSAISYASVKAPYGFPIQRRKWQLTTLIYTLSSITPTVNTWYNIAGAQVIVPAGEWNASYRAAVGQSGPSAQTVVQVGLSTSPTSETILKSRSVINQISNTQIIISVCGDTDYSQSLQNPLYLIIRSAFRNGDPLYLAGTDGPAVILLENAYI